MAKKAKTREEIKAELMDKCFAAGVGKKPLKWISKHMYEMLRPKCHLVIDNHIFRLRYVKEFDTPFEEDQPEGDVRLDRINIDEYELETGASDLALNMFLMLNPLNEENGGKRYRLENKKKEAEDALTNYELIDNAIAKIRDSNLEQIKAALHVITGWDTIDMGSSEVRLELRKQVETIPEVVIRAFEDETTEIKFKFFTAKRLGYLVSNNEETTLKWGGTEKIFFTIPMGQNLAEQFANHCLSEKGKPILAALNEKLK